MLGDVSAINSAIGSALGDVSSLATGNIVPVAGVTLAFAGLYFLRKLIRSSAR